MPVPEEDEILYESFQKYDEQKESKIDFKDYILKFNSANVDSKDYDVRGFSREEFENLQKNNRVPKSNDRYERRYTVFDQKYISELEFDESDDKLFVDMSNIAGLDKQEQKAFNPQEISKAIANRVFNEFDFRDSNRIAYDVNIAKIKTMNFLLGNGNPNNSYDYFLDKKLQKENILAFDTKKVDGFVKNINSNLDKLMKTVTNPSSEFYKRRTYNMNNTKPYEKLVDSFKEINSDKVGLEGNNLIRESLKDTSANPEKSVDILKNYLSLKDKVNNYPADEKEKNAELYKNEKESLPLIKNYLENVCKIDVDSINKGNFEAESKAYLERSNKKDPFAHDLYNLEKNVEEYNSHNFFWKLFKGGDLRSRINKSSNELIKNGMNKDLVDMLKSGSSSDSKVDKVHEELRDKLSDNSISQEERIKAEKSLNVLSSIADEDKKDEISHTIDEYCKPLEEGQVEQDLEEEQLSEFTKEFYKDLDHDFNFDMDLEEPVNNADSLANPMEDQKDGPSLGDR